MAESWRQSINNVRWQRKSAGVSKKRAAWRIAKLANIVRNRQRRWLAHLVQFTAMQISSGEKQLSNEGSASIYANIYGVI